jgi:1-acyl-sn-glycerol-3-phosphate acyltransferase
MLRAIITIMAMTLIVIFLGIPTLLIGLVYPARPVVAACSLIWARTILICSGVRLTVEGKEHLFDGIPRFFMGNHQSALDVPILMAALNGDVRFLAKNTLFRIPIFGWVMFRYGYVPIHRGNARITLRMLEDMLQHLRRKPISFAVFPEGTRSRDGRLLVFRRGTMKIAQRSGLDVVPFSIDGSGAVHHRDHLFRASPGPVKLVFGEPIPAEQVAAMSATELHRHVVETVSRQLGHAVGLSLRAAESDATARDHSLVTSEKT